MPHATVKLSPGIDQNETQALNEAGMSISNLVRFVCDRNGIGLIEKLGGWTKFFPNTMVSIVRALLGWQDLDLVKHLGYGTQNIGMTGQAQLGVITNGSQQNITPTTTTDNVTPAASATSGSSTITITDATTIDITSFDVVYIETHISVGGIVLYGLYPTTQVSSTTYDVTATDVLGNPLEATSTSTTTTVASFTTVSGSNVVTVVLDNHGYSVGSTYPVLVSTSLGGVVLYGNYLVQSVIDANTFTILSALQAISSTTSSINGGDARLLYSFSGGVPTAGTGYGIGGYGTGGYGSGTAIVPAVGTPIGAMDWTLDNWGEILLACPVNGTLFQPIFQWDPLSGAPFASVIAAAPPINDGFFVAMPERQIVVWGTTATGLQDPLLVRWCDVNNFNVWIGQPTNQAGQYRIPKGSKIVGGIQGPNQGLLWTDIDLWSMQYINVPDVYGFNEIGTGCGLISRKAMGLLGDVAYWMGPSQFFALTPAGATSEGGVAPVPCPVWDVVYQDLDTSNLDKIRTAVNSRFNEIAWYFPTNSSGGEVAAYVKLNVQTGAWDYGSLARSAWIDQSVLGPPIGADPNLLYLYQHETSPDADGQPLLASFQTGYFTIGDGEYKTFVDQWWPDAKWGLYGGAANATLNLTFYVTDYPGQTPARFGPYALTQATTFITPRFRGRLVSIGMASDDVGSFWRIGANRYRFMPDGKF